MNLTMCTIYGYGLSVYALCPQNLSQIEFKLNKTQLIQNQVQQFDQQKHITFINPKSFKYSGYYLYHSNEGDLVSIFSAKTFLFQIIQRNVQDFCVAFDRLFVIRDNFLYEKRIDMQSYNSGLTNLNITISNGIIYGTQKNLIICRFFQSNVCEFYNSKFEVVQSLSIKGKLIKSYQTGLIFQRKHQMTYLDFNTRSITNLNYKAYQNEIYNVVQTMDNQFIDQNLVVHSKIDFILHDYNIKKLMGKLPKIWVIVSLALLVTQMHF
ncbi:Hypothetical_protein [Hexamita inflata]|uniref:Hypothetical_protein n=1 Tax=Hexamita inflata TaxID=28002 RepID=A0ABP1HMX1_9EUKA